MFTGIIEEVGTLLATRKASKSESLTIEAPYVLQDAKVGDSIAVNGICLTATSISGQYIYGGCHGGDDAADITWHTAYRK